MFFCLSFGRSPVGVGAFDDPQIRLTPIGEVIEKYLLSSENIRGVKIDRYVIMPDHIHLVLLLNVERATARVAPTEENGDRNSVTLGRIVGAYKSMIADTRRKMCDQENVQTGAIWQRGYYDHVIRSPEELYRIRKYIRENPIRKYYEQDRIHTMSTRKRTCK